TSVHHSSRTAKVFLQTRPRFSLKDNWSGFVVPDLPLERLSPHPGVAPGSHGAFAAYPMRPCTSARARMSDDARSAASRDTAADSVPEWQTGCGCGMSDCWGLGGWKRGAGALDMAGQIGAR